MGIDKEIGQSGNTIVPWSSFFDLTEENPNLAWPNGLQVFDQMRSSDVQIAAMLLAGTLPIRRYRWFIMQEGASDEVTEFVANDIALPIQGKDPVPLPRQRDRFSFDFHLRHALLMIVYGAMFFEQVYRIEDDGKAHLRKLGPRMPRTISEIQVEPDGGLAWIRQFPAGLSNIILPARTKESMLPPQIPVDRLVAYVNDREGSHWFGRSVLRPVFGDWTIKDRLMRVDAMKHERNGLGIPMIEAPEGATPKMLEELNALAQAYKAGEKAGGALPYGARLRLVGTEGSLPDTLASIRYHDEQIAKALLKMFMQLGTTKTGARALGDTLVNFFGLGQEAIARSIAEVFSEHVIEDLVDLNWGPDEPAPRLGFEPEKDEKLAVADLGILVDHGLVVVDEELEEHVRSMYDLPRPSTDSTKPSETSKPAPSKEVKTADPTPDSAKKAAARLQRVLNKAVASGRELRRNMYPHEEQAMFNIDSLETTHTNATAELIAAWGAVKAAQIEELGHAD